MRMLLFDDAPCWQLYKIQQKYQNIVSLYIHKHIKCNQDIFVVYRRILWIEYDAANFHMTGN